MHTYEVEIKSLLGEKKHADELENKLSALFPNLLLKEDSKQLNHYFLSPDLSTIEEKIAPHLSKADLPRFQNILKEGKKISVRTRLLNDTVLLVLKASVDDTTSSNGISRIEFEVEVPDLTLNQLDQLLLDASLEYQAKWSRERRAFSDGTFTVCIDKNAGYGYLAEFEKIITDQSKVEETQAELRKIMSQVNAEELRQDRLERMFAFYNEHWNEYYGTEKMFVIQ